MLLTSLQVTIEDVIGPGICMCRTDDDKVLDGGHFDFGNVCRYLEILVFMEFNHCFSINHHAKHCLGAEANIISLFFINQGSC